MRAGNDGAAQCSDPRELRAILDRLQSGDEGRYMELEAFTERRMVECMGPAERRAYLVLKSEASPSDVAAARADIAGWVDKIKTTDASLKEAAGGAAGGDRGAAAAARGAGEGKEVFETAAAREEAPAAAVAPGACVRARRTGGAFAVGWYGVVDGAFMLC